MLESIFNPRPDPRGGRRRSAGVPWAPDPQRRGASLAGAQPPKRSSPSPGSQPTERHPPAPPDGRRYFILFFLWFFKFKVSSLISPNTFSIPPSHRIFFFFFFFDINFWGPENT